MLKKLLSLTIGATLLISTSVSAGERMAKDKEVHNPNNYTILEDYDNGMTLLLPDYFKQVYKDTDDILEQYIPMYFKGELFPYFSFIAINVGLLSFKLVDIASIAESISSIL